MSSSSREATCPSSPKASAWPTASTECAGLPGRSPTSVRSPNSSRARPSSSSKRPGSSSVGDPITRYFQGVPSDKAGVTLHQLLTHSSGLSDPDIDDFDPVPLEEYVKQTFARPLLFAPGKGYSYSNANFSLLGAILEKLSGTTYETFLRERLFLPNGMFETGYTLPAWGESRFAQGYEAGGGRWGTFLERPTAADGPHWALRANGGIHTTVYDMLRWARALLTGRVLTPESMKKLWSPHVSEGGGTFYGYGWSIAKAPDGTKIVTHNGGNGIYFADLAIVPDPGLVAFVMTNVIAENRSANSLLEQLEMRFLAGRAYPSIPEIVDLPEAALKAFAGTYKPTRRRGGVSDYVGRPGALHRSRRPKRVRRSQFRPRGRARPPRQTLEAHGGHRRREHEGRLRSALEGLRRHGGPGAS